MPFEFVYDSASGKYGYKDGADTFRPFNDGSATGSTVYYLGTNYTYNIKTLLPDVDYTSLTASNFIVCGGNASRVYLGDGNAGCAEGVSLSVTYNNTTGVLSIKSTSAGQTANGFGELIRRYWGGSPSHSQWQMFTCKSYLVVGTIQSVS